MQLTFYIETYGCQMNKAESLALCAQMMQLGYKKVDQPQDAAWLIINTCSVRQTAEDKVIGRLGLFKSLKKKHHFKIAVMGCMGERIKEVLAKTYEVDAIIGNFNKKLFIERLKEDIRDPHAKVSHATEYPLKPIPQKKKGIVTYGVLAEQYDFFHYHQSLTKTTAFVPIMHGCNHFCTFCIVPYVRGREISREPQDIIQELQKHVDNGVKEITLLGQNVNSYHHQNTDFVQLLKKISTQLTGHVWLRFLSSHPKDFAPELLDVLDSDSRFARHLHLALQHSNNRLLAEMNRQHTQQEFVNLVAEIRKRWPGMSLSTDLMIGFPSETDAEFEELLDFLDIIQFDDAFTYQYNDREGTIAARRPDKVPEETKTQRIQKMIEKQRSITQNKLQKKIGTQALVLVESTSRHDQTQMYGRSEYNENVVFAGSPDLIGKFVQVQISSRKGQTLYGEKID
ncbi:MAG: tRNA (N6-isopentenyl adenosine(37)-C2)-methylthiotransferase MiaB [Spirochaetia bacterium]